jgi:hypothetical protein
MREPEREQDGLTPAERELEAAMRALRPAPAALDRDRLLFEAGATIGRAGARRSVLAWRAAAAIVAVALGASWVWRGPAGSSTSRTQERIVYVERPGSGAVDQADEPSDDEGESVTGRFAAGTRSDPFDQSFARPGDGYFALRGAVAFRGVNAVREVRAAFAAAQVPTARPAATAAPSLPG